MAPFQAVLQLSIHSVSAEQCVPFQHLRFPITTVVCHPLLLQSAASVVSGESQQTLDALESDPMDLFAGAAAAAAAWKRSQVWRLARPAHNRILNRRSSMHWLDETYFTMVWLLQLLFHFRLESICQVSRPRHRRHAVLSAACQPKRCRQTTSSSSSNSSSDRY